MTKNGKVLRLIARLFSAPRSGQIYEQRKINVELVFGEMKAFLF